MRGAAFLAPVNRAILIGFADRQKARPTIMSVAFTREQDLEATAADLPDRPISQHPNLVTREGLAALDEALAAARAAYAAAQASGDIQTDRTAMARATRDLRYYAARRATAELVEPTHDPDVAAFGSTVTFDREDGRRQTFRIVGEDEADPAKGSVSYVSPLARALIGKRAGDAATLPNGEVEIVAVG
ncbi:transcription elongation factor GreB [Methylopila jiangsuensis]|uniref:Transcription elongation factor GreB n=2 Tax=Methylopila jiangsuensis TaxID=586230 RepID=A0A9W6JKN1_9HYPH|nr:transcription elongation factor GreB [Methylopila jiangsuensis]